MRMRRVLAAAVALLAGVATTAVVAPAVGAAPCGGTYTIVVGGFNDRDSMVWTGNVSQRVGYSAALSGQSAREGVNELNRLVRDQRRACPYQHAKVMGYSEGAAVVHIWVSENWRTFGNVNAVLVADPKRQATGGRGTDGLAGQLYAIVVGAPLYGSDSSFGNIPTVTLCTDDVICDSSAPSGWIGYATGAHQNYSFDVDVYSNTGDGEWFNGVFFPR
jgi:cutinase